MHIIDQTKLPWALEIVRLTDVEAAAHAIRAMQVRGAPLIGAVAAYGLCLALRLMRPLRRWSGMRRCSGRDSADGGEFALGDGADADAAAQHRQANACAPPMPRRR